MNIVSGFLSNANTRQDRPLNKYLTLGQIFINVMPTKGRTTLLLERAIFNQLTFPHGIMNDQRYLSNDGKLKVIFFEHDDNYLNKYIEQISLLPDISHPEKNTPKYMTTMNAKPEMMRIAIEDDQTAQNHPNINWIWIDFGIAHLFDNSADILATNFNPQLFQSFPYSPFFASCWDKSHYIENPLTQIIWQFAGGVFGGRPHDLLRFADMAKEKCLKVIEEYKTLPWEVNIWHLIYKEHPHFFYFYHANHDRSILFPTNLKYIPYYFSNEIAPKSFIEIEQEYPRIN